MIDRLLTTMVRFGRFAADALPAGYRAVVGANERLGPILGKTTSYGLKGLKKAGVNITGKAADFVKKEGPQKFGRRAGKFAAYTAHDIENNIRGVNNMAGAALNGFETKWFNDKANTLLKTNKFTGHRAFNIIKDSPNGGVLTGKKATVYGTTLIATGGAILSAKDAVVDKVHAQQGRVVGSAGNAPVNNYAYQGASYADNAGATGDLVLSMHRQRHSGIL